MTWLSTPLQKPCKAVPDLLVECILAKDKVIEIAANYGLDVSVASVKPD